MKYDVTVILFVNGVPPLRFYTTFDVVTGQLDAFIIGFFNRKFPKWEYCNVYGVETRLFVKTVYNFLNM